MSIIVAIAITVVVCVGIGAFAGGQYGDRQWTEGYNSAAKMWQQAIVDQGYAEWRVNNIGEPSWSWKEKPKMDAPPKLDMGTQLV